MRPLNSGELWIPVYSGFRSGPDCISSVHGGDPTGHPAGKSCREGASMVGNEPLPPREPALFITLTGNFFSGICMGRGLRLSHGMIAVLLIAGILIIVSISLFGPGTESPPGAADGGATGLYSGNLRVLTTPDIHSHVFPMGEDDTGSRIGRIGRLGDTLEGEVGETLFLFAGDLGEGGFYNMYSGIPEAGACSMAGMDAAVLGNHAFDFGVSPLRVWDTNSSYRCCVRILISPIPC